MASSKTLSPTNVTISIPAMTDVPDASVFSNCVDKLADAVNTLNIKKTSITATTGSSGAFNSGITKPVISATMKTNDALYTCVVTRASGANAWITIYNLNSWTRVANTEVTVEIVYLDNI